MSMHPWHIPCWNGGEGGKIGGRDEKGVGGEGEIRYF